MAAHANFGTWCKRHTQSGTTNDGVLKHMLVTVLIYIVNLQCKFTQRKFTVCKLTHHAGNSC